MFLGVNGKRYLIDFGSGTAVGKHKGIGLHNDEVYYQINKEHKKAVSKLLKGFKKLPKVLRDKIKGKAFVAYFVRP